MDNVTISFPGIGIDNFTVDKIAFSVFGVEVRWYGLIITIGMILAFFYASYRAKHEKISFDDMLDFAIFIIIFGVIGARLYYVLTTIKDDLYHSFIDVIATWNGGLAIYGGIIGGIIAAYVVCRVKKLSFFKITDTIAPGVMIGQILGRWGNFFNGEAYGYEVAEESHLYFIRMGLIPNIDSSTIMHYYHPTFLYESLWNLVGFIIINSLYKKKKFDGQVFLMYLAWYGFGRMFIEGLRTDSLYVGVFRISQVVGFVCFLLGIIAIVYGINKSRKLQLQGVENYIGVYDKLVGIKETKAPYEAVKKSKIVETKQDDDDDGGDEDDDEEDDDDVTDEKEKPTKSEKDGEKNFNDYSSLLFDSTKENKTSTETDKEKKDNDNDKLS